MANLMACESNLIGTADDLEPGTINVKVQTDDLKTGISGVMVEIHYGSERIKSEFTNDFGIADFERLEPGDYQVKIVLPLGYEVLDNLELAVRVDGGKHVVFDVKPVREVLRTVNPGTKETLATSSGAFVEVDASQSDRAVDVVIEEINDYAHESLFDSKPVRITVGPAGQGKRTSDSYGIYGGMRQTGSEIGLTVWQITAEASDAAAFAFNTGSESSPLYLFADAEKTTFVDPNTGKTHTVPLKRTEIPSDVDFSAVVHTALMDDACWDQPDLRRLEKVPGHQVGTRPVIFIHGWQPFNTRCRDFKDFDHLGTFSELIRHLADTPDVRNNFRFYTYTYPTNAPILAASNDLYNKIMEKGLENPILIGHSMGGLVGRGLIAQNGADNIGALITLGTPHKGSPLADITWVAGVVTSVSWCISNPTLCMLSHITDAGFFPNTMGLRDLSPESELIQSLRVSKEYNEKIFTLGGRISDKIEIESPSLPTVDPILKGNVETIMKLYEEVNVDHDLIVPLNSAIPDWSVLQTSMKHHNHLNIHKTREIADQIIPILSVLSECSVPPVNP